MNKQRKKKQKGDKGGLGNRVSVTQPKPSNTEWGL